MKQSTPTHKSISTPVSPISPTSPTALTSIPSTSSIVCKNEENVEYKENGEILRLFTDIGLQNPTKITDTLQGTVWRAFQTDQTNPLIIKITDKLLHQRSRAMVDNQEFKVNENILKERKILKYINQQKQCPPSIVKYNRFLQTDKHLCLIMEDGGGSLFDLVKEAHKCIKTGHLEVSEWNKTLKIMFKQMLKSVSYIHSHNVAHFDISLENFLINDVDIELDEYSSQKWKMRFVGDDIRVKLCDFGLAEIFESKDCMSNKYCGKRHYKSPEIVYQQNGFDAKKNDIWCLGVCWLIMCIGFIPWNIAHESDPLFSFLSNHSLADLLERWNLSNYVDAKLIYLFDSIFLDEAHRMSIDEINKYL